MPTTHESDEVHALLKERARTGNRDDGATVAVVLEGGGMRGVLSATTAAVLYETGVLDHVDLFVGTSAGAVNAASAVGGTISEFANAYASTFSKPEFVDPRRALRRQPIVNLPALCAEVERSFSVFSHAAANTSKRLAVVATDVATGLPAVLTDFTSPEDLQACVVASGLLPLIGGQPVAHRGRLWFDGGVSEAVPIPTAVELGATHVIVAATRPQTVSPSVTLADRAVVSYLKRYNTNLARSYAERPARYRELMDEAFTGNWHGIPTLVIAPGPHDPVPGRLERDPARITVARLVARERAQVLLRRSAV